MKKKWNKNYHNDRYAHLFLYCMSWTRHTLLTLKNFICDRRCKILSFFSGIHIYLNTPYGLTCYRGRFGWAPPADDRHHLSMIGATCRWLVFGSIWSQLVFWQHVQVWTSSIKYCNFYPKYMKKYIRQKNIHSHHINASRWFFITSNI